jgi:hypothetical protein
MLELREWIRAAGFDSGPWLMLGKGPTFSRHAELDLTGYHLLSLNHVVRELAVDVAHIIDIDVVEACADRLTENCRWLLMPRVPHIQNRPGFARLEDYRDALPVLRRLDARGQLVWYNAETAPRVGDSPVIEVRYFSSEAALSILGELGSKVVRSLGIDGGTSYSASFSSLATRLANQQPSFDLQFSELERIAQRHGIDYQPLIRLDRDPAGAATAAAPDRSGRPGPVAESSAAAVALAAAFDRIDQIERRQLRARFRRAAAPLLPLIRRARARGPSSRAGAAVERVADTLWRRLR